MEEQDNYQPTMLQRAFVTTCYLMSETTEYLASFSVGQSVLKQTDRALWAVEKCAEWSVPSPPQQKHNHQNGTFGKPGPLIRPLPWIFFLPMLLFIRLTRLSLNIFALLLGLESVKAITVVKFIQGRRRRIRALKFLGLRRIRHKNTTKGEAMTYKDRFYNIMSRAMCFRVTNSDLDEEITVRKEGEESPNLARNSNATKQPVTGKLLKRKYIEILKNNCSDWDDVEDDEELIDRITQLAEDDLGEDPDYLPAEDSGTEEDSMSDAEEDNLSSNTIVTSTNSSPKQLKRLSSHGSLANEIIEEENEDSESTTINSDDESTQQLDKSDVSKKVDHLEPGTASNSEEFYSPINSVADSPEPNFGAELTKHQNNSTKTDEKVTVKTHPPITARSLSAHNSNGRMKKHKNKRRFANLLRRKTK